MKKTGRLLCLFLAVWLPWCFGGCGTQKKGTAEMLEDFCKWYDEMPAGACYTSEATEWEAGYVSPALSAALFAEDNGENAFSLCTEYAIFLSAAKTGGEIAILRTREQADATRVAKMCTSRIARIKATWPEAPILEGACVLRQGQDVILLLMPDNARASDICRRI